MLTPLIISIFLAAPALNASPSMAALSQENKPAPKNICKTDPHFKDWDFWVGNWTVIDAATGKHAGTNVLEKSEDGCIISESWTGAGGSKGFSINYYNPATQKWRQVWVAGPGYEIDYEGGLNKDGAMVLEGLLTTYSNNKSQAFRGTWTARGDGTVRQLFEIQNDKGTWSIWFDGIYSRMK